MNQILGSQTYRCSCGSNIWNIQMILENGGMALYFDNMSCANCGVSANNSSGLDGGIV